MCVCVSGSCVQVHTHEGPCAQPLKHCMSHSLSIPYLVFPTSAVTRPAVGASAAADRRILYRNTHSRRMHARVVYCLSVCPAAGPPADGADAATAGQGRAAAGASGREEAGTGRQRAGAGGMEGCIYHVGRFASLQWQAESRMARDGKGARRRACCKLRLAAQRFTSSTSE